MGHFCSNCGAQISDGARFCGGCGQAATIAQVQPQVVLAQPSVPQQAYAQPRYVGWTTKHLDPAVRNRAVKTKRMAWIFTLFLTVAFPIGFIIAGNVSDTVKPDEGMLIGLGLGAFMFIIGFVQILKMKTGTWDGVITDKTQKRVSYNDNDEGPVRYRTRYTLHVARDNGKRQKINFFDSQAMFDYFNVGDRIRNHLAFHTYEKFDKSHDSQIFCNICGKVNDIDNDTCRFCKLPLFK